MRNPAPSAVRQGASRGRSSTLWKRLSRVSLRSANGHSPSTVNTSVGNRRPPHNGLGTSVYFPIVKSNPGTSRIAPISQPRYQSGCAPFVERPTSYGPHSQIGLIWTSPPRRNRTAAVPTISPSDLGVWPGNVGIPMTLRSPSAFLRRNCVW